MNSKPKQLEDYVAEVDYEWMNTKYVPTPEAIEFVNFIKLVNGGKGEENKTPVMHMVMLDDLIHKNDNLFVVHRGGAKALSLTTPLPTPNGNVTVGDIQVGDPVYTRDGVVTTVTAKSEVFNKPMYCISLVDGRKLEVSEDHLNIVQKRKTGKGVLSGTWEEYVLTTADILAKGVHYTRKVSEHTPTGKEAKWYIPTCKGIELPQVACPIDPYTVGAILGDGSIDKVCGFTRIHSHVDDMPHWLATLEGASVETVRTDSRRETTQRVSLLGIGARVKEFIGTENVYGKRIPATLLWGSRTQRIAVLQGLMDTDGTLGTSNHGSFCTVSEGLANDVAWLVRSLGGEVIYGNEKGDYYRLHIRTDFCPFRLERKVAKWVPCLRGRTAIESIEPILQVPSQCIAVADKTHSFLAESFVVTHNTTVVHEYAFLYMAVYGTFFGWGEQHVAMYVSDTMENGVKSMREQLQFRWQESAFLQKYVPKAKFTDDRWEFTNIEGKRFFVKGFGATTGVRGFKMYGKRPTWCGFDDMLSDKNAKSSTILADIESVIYKAATEALHPTNRKICWTGTPFNKKDSLYTAVASGAWNVRCFPIAEKFPCSEEEFRGSWEDRFTYKSTKENFEKKLKAGMVSAFNQELMLRITSEDDRLIQDSDIQWYSRNDLLRNRHAYNFYITTDFATSAKQSADYSVISVWAYNNAGYWFLVDGVCERQTMDKNIDALFKYAQLYKPQSVGVEVTGQQGGFIAWIKKEMLLRNQWFSFASDGNGKEPGIRPNTNKLVRFNTVLPWFKAAMIFLPEEWRNKEKLIIEAEDELTSVTNEGFKSAHDDVADTISMLSVMKPWKPSDSPPLKQNDATGIWEEEDDFGNGMHSDMDSYVV